jgi:hypothetical protein
MFFTYSLQQVELGPLYCPFVCVRQSALERALVTFFLSGLIGRILAVINNFHNEALLLVKLSGA